MYSHLLDSPRHGIRLLHAHRQSLSRLAHVSRPPLQLEKLQGRVGVLDQNLRAEAAVVTDDVRGGDVVSRLAAVGSHASESVDAPEAALSARGYAAHPVLADVRNEEPKKKKMRRFFRGGREGER